MPEKSFQIPIEKWIYRELKHIASLKPDNAHKAIIKLLQDVKPISRRTSQQNRALHKDFAIIAEKLNDAGLDMRKLLKSVSIPWTTISVKEYIWRVFQKAMYKKTSTTKLDKNAEIEKIHEVIMRELGEKFGIEWHDFPSEE